jgi:hypothetical protein
MKSIIKYMKRILKKIYDFAYYEHPWIYESLIAFIVFLILFAIALILVEFIKYLFGQIGGLILLICIFAFVLLL